MTKEFKVTIKEQQVEVGETKYWIKTETNEQKIEFKDEVKKKDKANNKLKIMYIKDEDYKKDKSDSKWTKYDAEVEYDSGPFFHGVKLDEKLDTAGNMKEAVKPSIGFFKSMKIPMYISLVVILLAIIGLIWWWISSSNKEDKEEESL